MSHSMIPKELLPIIGDYVFPTIDDFCESLPNDDAKWKAASKIIRSMNDEELVCGLAKEAKLREFKLKQKQLELLFVQCVTPYDATKILHMFGLVRYTLATRSDYGYSLTLSNVETNCYVNIILDEDKVLRNAIVGTGSELYDYVRDKQTIRDFQRYGQRDNGYNDFYLMLIHRIIEMCDTVINQ